MPGGRPCSAASPAAICGRAARRTAPTRSASSAIPISSAPTARAAGKFAHAEDAGATIAAHWPQGERRALRGAARAASRCCSWIEALVDALHAAGFEIAIETNGTLPVPPAIDWICVSPKADAPLVVTKGNELKVVIPQDNQHLADYAKLDFEYFLVQPMDGPSRDFNTKLAIDWCKRHPQWRLSMQTHKYLNIP